MARQQIVDLQKLAEAQEAADAAQEAATLAAEKVAAAIAALMPQTDKPATFTMRLKSGTLAAIEASARKHGITLKQRIMRALAADGVEVVPADLEDGTPGAERHEWRGSVTANRLRP